MTNLAVMDAGVCCIACLRVFIVSLYRDCVKLTVSEHVDGWSSILTCTDSGLRLVTRVVCGVTESAAKSQCMTSLLWYKICANDEAGPPDEAVVALIRPISGPPQLV